MLPEAINLMTLYQDGTGDSTIESSGGSTSSSSSVALAGKGKDSAKKRPLTSPPAPPPPQDDTGESQPAAPVKRTTRDPISQDQMEHLADI